MSIPVKLVTLERRSKITLDSRGASTQGATRTAFPSYLVIVMRRERLQLTFGRPFSITGIDRLLPPGDYELVPDYELTSEPCFPVYRQIVTLLLVPSQAYRRSSVVKTNVHLLDILASHRRDQADALETNSKAAHAR